MLNINPFLLKDFYKCVHAEQYPEGVTKIVSYWTPRMSRILEWDTVIMFGVQAFIEHYLVDYFNEFFFKQPLIKVKKEYQRVLDNCLGKNSYRIERLEELHKLGFLPIAIRALPEGTRVPIHVPMLEIYNTHPEFAWLVNSLESLLSGSIWNPMVCANVGYSYREIVNYYYNLTVEDDISRAKALGDFGYRGGESNESEIKASAAWLLSFLNTATVPAIPWLEYYYYCDVEKELVGLGGISTEHSVMCSNAAVDGDETTMVKRLLTEIYPNNSFSMVSDSYDYWNMIDVILPQCKEEILNHNGTLLIRGDSGDPVDITTKTVFKLWETFGGNINNKGYKVLNSKIKVIYGDSITTKRCRKIYQILLENGFACNNVVLGVGSFSFQCWEDDNGKLSPFTRDTFGFAIKATYCEDKNKKPIFIFKNPKTDTGNFKKSQKGCCIVYEGEDGKLTYRDEKTFEEVRTANDNLLKIVFMDGIMYNRQSLQEIRAKLHNNKF